MGVSKTFDPNYVVITNENKGIGHEISQELNESGRKANVVAVTTQYSTSSHVIHLHMLAIVG